MPEVKTFLGVSLYNSKHHLLGYELALVIYLLQVFRKEGTLAFLETITSLKSTHLKASSFCWALLPLALVFWKSFLLGLSFFCFILCIGPEKWAECHI